MPQAKVLTAAELKRVLAFVSAGRHAARNRALILTSFYTGMRVGELAALRVQDVFDRQGKPRDQVRLRPEQTKGGTGRIIYLNTKARRELGNYSLTIPASKGDAPLFYSQRRPLGFTANTLCQTINGIYSAAGVKGGTSHSGRRTYITALAEKGVATHHLMALAGHKHLATTQRYIETNPLQLQRVVELL